MKVFMVRCYHKKEFKKPAVTPEHRRSYCVLVFTHLEPFH